MSEYTQRDLIDGGLSVDAMLADIFGNVLSVHRSGDVVLVWYDTGALPFTTAMVRSRTCVDKIKFLVCVALMGAIVVFSVVLAHKHARMYWSSEYGLTRYNDQGGAVR
jgi:hypothetical protein